MIRLKPRILALIAQPCRAIATGILLVSLSLAQQTSQEPAKATIHVQSDLVVVPFQFRRRSRSVSDLKPSDVVLLEDGVPRGFTIFEAPPNHLTLDVVVMFDITTPRPDPNIKRIRVWDAKSLQEMAGYWSETITRRLLDERAATIRFSIYRFDQSKLERLCQSTNDPKVLLDALRRLPGPSPSGQATGQDVNIPLPAGLAVRDLERKALKAPGHAPEPWSLAGAVAALRDSATVPSFSEGEKGTNKEAARALVIFSTGGEGTSVTPQDLAEQALAAGVRIYPVALFSFPPIVPYDGYAYDPLFYYEAHGGRSMWGPGGPYSPMSGPRDRPDLPRTAPPVAPYINYPFEVLGDLTGGRRFEAVNHSEALGDSGGRYIFDHTADLVFSMNGRETDEILEKVKSHALADFSSNYTVGFVPSPTEAPHEHKLEVKLAPKSEGKVTDGKRNAMY